MKSTWCGNELSERSVQCDKMGGWCGVDEWVKRNMLTFGHMERKKVNSL